jgi:hypothetical protein
MHPLSHKNSLKSSLQAEYGTLLKTIAQVPFKLHKIKAIDGTESKVSISDLIAYQIGWGTLLISWYAAGIEGKMPEMPGDGFKDWDYVGLAQRFYAKYQYADAKEQLDALYKITQTILKIIDTEDQKGNLDKLGVWQWCTTETGQQWPLSKWIEMNTVAPYKRATALIRKFAKTI